MAPSREANLFHVAYAMLVVAYLVPLFVTPVLPGLDLPFHAALADMVTKAGDPGSPYAPFYALRLWPTPPALPWLLVALASKVTGAYAMHVVVAGYVAALPLAVASYARALGGSRLAALLAFPLAFNVGLHYGFLGYVLSLPALFAMLAVAARIALEGATARRGVGLAIAACALYGLHLETYVLGLVMVLAIAVLARGTARARWICGLAMAPSFVVAAIWNGATPYATGPAQRGTFALARAIVAERGRELGTQSVGADLAQHLAGIPVHLLRGFKNGVDLRASHALLLFLAAWLAWAFVRRDRPVDVDPRRIALRAALPVLMLSAYLVLPHHLDAFEAMSISPRLVPLFVLAVVATLPQLALRDGARVALERVAAAGLATYAIVLTSRYAAYGAEVDALATVIRAVPAGERVVGLIESGESSVMNVESILRAVPSAYVSLRADRRSMVPLRYCGMRHIPCARTPSADALPETNPWRPEAFDARAPGNVFTFAITDRPIVGGALAGRRVSTVAHRGRFTAVRFE